ncbi:TspO/MBR family protein [Facklamia sp. 7083-14-GEN3]|uniref:TspO/MBR family protein n=1 Tax=Facklamia sp. 7083-14-GEN3 TaxID=2973478 RepID=UPI00215B836E|nr:TspO/MBR family protein [Facklamia sp. 7083-14-GEN3]MCR8969621.1 tryptophan-rich sensory protein [Facklamia sp. 7083-14-GEN3]
MKVKKWLLMAAPLVGGSIVGGLTAGNAKSDYENYKQPPLAPPKQTFGIVWPLLYTMMGVARGIIQDTKNNDAAVLAYRTQLGLNYLWSLLYFKFKFRGTALIESFGLFAAVLVTTIKFYQKKPKAGLLLLPYLIWCGFASYLNGGTLYLNRDRASYSND